MVVERTLGEFLRMLRRRALLTQEQLAERAKLSVRAISDIERGKRGHTGHIRPSTVKSLVKALQLSGSERQEFEAVALHLPFPSPCD